SHESGTPLQLQSGSAATPIPRTRQPLRTPPLQVAAPTEDGVPILKRRLSQRHCLSVLGPAGWGFDAIPIATRIGTPPKPGLNMRDGGATVGTKLVPAPVTSMKNFSEPGLSLFGEAASSWIRALMQVSGGKRSPYWAIWTTPWTGS